MPALRRLVARQINELRKTEPAQRHPVDVWFFFARGAGGDDAADGCKVHARRVDGTGRGNADKGRARGFVKGKKAVGGSVVPPLAE